MSEAFDIREFLTNRAYPKSTVRVLLSEETAFKLAAVRDEHARNADQTKQAELDKRLQSAETENEAAKAIVHVRATSTRAKEEINSKVLAEVPYERDMYGRDKVENELLRSRVMRELLFLAHITAIESPDGRVQSIDPTSDGRDVIRAFLDFAPESSVALVDATIVRLTARAEMERAQTLDPNTLPES